MEEMEPFLPSKKIILFFITALVLGGGFLVLAEFGSRAQIAQQNNIDTVEQNGARGQSEQDTDGDGLKDWEETLWGTDPHNPDTDGDGTPDGQEIKEGRDPKVAGPDDDLPEPEKQQALETSARLDTQTGTLSRNVLTQIARLQQSGTVNEEDIGNIVAEITSQTLPATSGSQTYSHSDLPISSDNNQDALRTYANTLGVIAKNAIEGYSGPDELEIVKTAIINKDPNEFEKLEKAVAVYRSMEQDLLSVSVPSYMTDYHLSLVNNISKIANALEEMSSFLDDPVRGIGAIKQYQDGGLAVETALLRIKSELVKNGVAFTKSEPGYIFFE